MSVDQVARVDRATPIETRLAPPARRGRLEIADRVVARIAGHAAREVESVAGRTGGVLGRGGRPDFDAVPDVEVRLHGSSARIRIALALAFPVSIRGAVADVRTRVRSRVEELSGIDVDRVDVIIKELVPSGGRSLT